MLRTQPNEKEMFSATLTASAEETKAALLLRRAEMDQAWDEIDEGWKELDNRMAKIGITKPFSSSEGMVRLNVGGSHVNVRRSVLEGNWGSSSPSWTLDNLFEPQWDARLPRDADGRIVLDESPVCVKHLVHALFTGSSELGIGVLDNEQPYLNHVARALGLSPIGVRVVGGSTILRPSEERQLTAALQGWCPGNPTKLKLLFRASRDGWSPSTFHAKCDGSPSTITLFQVGSGDSASIAGGYSSVSWATIDHNHTIYRQDGRSCAGDRKESPGAFICMLKDGTGSTKHAFQPMKWETKPGQGANAVETSPDLWPRFGAGDLTSSATFSSDPGTLMTKPNAYDIPQGSAILSLNGKTLSEIEVFRVRTKASAASETKAATATQMNGSHPIHLPKQSNDDVRNFGAPIAGSLLEEAMALHLAEAELSRASARTTTCATSVAAVYGPDIAAGKKDPVVELSVRGTRMTTLRSTLRTCADSALAALFDDAKWPATKKDLDENGRRKIDCSPPVFSKVLDVLRMRKRSGWGNDGSKRSGPEMVHVAVKASDRALFEEFVHMYFPGCESFLTDHVKFFKEPNTTA